MYALEAAVLYQFAAVEIRTCFSDVLVNDTLPTYTHQLVDTAVVRHPVDMSRKPTPRAGMMKKYGVSLFSVMRASNAIPVCGRVRVFARADCRSILCAVQFRGWFDIVAVCSRSSVAGEGISGCVPLASRWKMTFVFDISWLTAVVLLMVFATSYSTRRRGGVSSLCFLQFWRVSVGPHFPIRAQYRTRSPKNTDRLRRYVRSMRRSVRRWYVLWAVVNCRSGMPLDLTGRCLWLWCDICSSPLAICRLGIWLRIGVPNSRRMHFVCLLSLSKFYSPWLGFRLDLLLFVVVPDTPNK